MTEQCHGEGPPQPGDRRTWDFDRQPAGAGVDELTAQGWSFISGKYWTHAETGARRVTVTMEFEG